MQTTKTSNGYNIQLTSDEYTEMREDYCGVCMNCGEITWDGCEPDMTNGPCESCDMEKVMGIEEMLMAGRVQIITQAMLDLAELCRQAEKKYKS